MTAPVLVAADEPPVEPGQPYVSPDDLASIGPLWEAAAAQTLIPVVAEVFHTSAGRVHARMVDATQVPTLPSIGSLAAEQYLAQAANTFSEVGDSLWATARAELLDGFEKGESIDQLAARLRGSAGLTARKATLVARTQVLDASNAGSIATARATGLELRKGWLDTPDQRTRPTHHQAGNTYGSDQGMIPLADQFTVGGYQCDRPHDPTLPPAERYNCRCTVIYSMVDAAVDDAVREAEPVPPIPGTSGIEPPPDPYAGDLVNPALPGPDTIPDLPAGVPITVRPTLEAARTTSAVSRVFGEEYQRITGRPPGYIDFQGSAATAREHAEGLLQGLERFPDARLDRVGPYSIKADSVEYAHQTGSLIGFNYHWTQPAARRRYLSALQSDVDSRWHPTGTGHPAGIALHEFGHILDTRDIYPDLDQLLARTAAVRDAELAARRAAGDLVDPEDFVAGSGVDGLIRREVSRYATTNRTELVAEAFADVMVNGDRASDLSKQIFTLLEAQYRRGGGTVRAVSREAALAVPSPTSALAARTVPQLRALAKERGITIPAGSKKADIVRLLDEAPSPGPGPAQPTFRGLLPNPQTALTAAEQARVRELVRRDPQIFATVKDRFGKISTSGNLSRADADWLDDVVRRDRAFVERSVQEAQIQRSIRDAARQADETVTEYRSRVAARLKDIFDDKPIAVRVRDEAALRDILAGGRFKTQLEGARRAPGLEASPERRVLGEKIMGVGDDVPIEQRPVYGYVAIHDIEPALGAGRKIAGIAEREGQEDILSVYGRVQVILRPEVRARTTATAGDSLDELGFVRPSPVDAPAAESLGIVRLSRLDDPDFTRSRYVEAQIHGGVRTDDIAAVVFPEAPSAAMAAALDRLGIPWRVLGRNDPPLRLSDVARPKAPPPPIPVPVVDVPAAEVAQADIPVTIHLRAGANMDQSSWSAQRITGVEDPDRDALSAFTSYVRHPGFVNTRLRTPTPDTDPEAWKTWLHEGSIDEMLGRTPFDWAAERSAQARADKLIAAIDRVISQSPISRPITVYRGGAVADIGLPEAGQAAGFSWTDAGYVSTSATRAVAAGSFGGGPGRFTLDIRIPEGSRALRIEGLGEDEVLLARGGRFRVAEDLRRPDGTGRVIVDLVSAEAPVPPADIPLAKRTVAQLRALAAERKITIPASARKPDIVRLLEAPPLTQAEERAAARALARETNRLIEESTANAQVLAEVDALLAKKAPAAAIREALDDALTAPGQLFAGADPAMLAALRAVAGDPVKLRAAVTRLGGKIKVKAVSKAGAKVVFDADTMEGVGGIDIPAGAKVTVVRRGSTVTLPDGTVMQLEKARVTPVIAPVKKAAPVKKRAPAAKTVPPAKALPVPRGATPPARPFAYQLPPGVTQQDATALRLALKRRHPIEGMPGADNAALVERLTDQNRTDALLAQFQRRVPAAQGLTEDQLKAELTELVRKAFADRQVATSITDDLLAQVLADGRFKTQFETGRSGGMFFPQERAFREEQWFGLPADAPVTERPVYGYLVTGNGGGMVDMYGEAQVIFRSDIRRRTTAIVGDSMGNLSYGRPAPVDAPDWYAFTIRLDDPDFARLDRDYDGLSFNRRGYIEAQIHGGVTVDDIAEVVFRSRPSDGLIELLRERGIPWRIRTS